MQGPAAGTGCPALRLIVPTVRAFVGCALDDAAMVRVIDAQRRARSIAEHAAWRCAWVAPSNLHVTIEFLGNVDVTSIDALRDAIARGASVHPPIDVELAGIDAFPRDRSPRVLYVAMRVLTGDLAAVARDIDTAVAPFGVPPEARPFRGHLTLARVKHAPRGEGVETFATKLAPMLAGAARIDAVTLYESELLADGPRYHVLGRYPLGTPNVPDNGPAVSGA